MFQSFFRKPPSSSPNREEASRFFQQLHSEYTSELANLERNLKEAKERWSKEHQQQQQQNSNNNNNNNTSKSLSNIEAATIKIRQSSQMLLSEAELADSMKRKNEALIVGEETARQTIVSLMDKIKKLAPAKSGGGGGTNKNQLSADQIAEQLKKEEEERRKTNQEAILAAARELQKYGRVQTIEASTQTNNTSSSSPSSSVNSSFSSPPKNSSFSSSSSTPSPSPHKQQHQHEQEEEEEGEHQKTQQPLSVSAVSSPSASPDNQQQKQQREKEQQQELRQLLQEKEEESKETKKQLESLRAEFQHATFEIESLQKQLRQVQDAKSQVEKEASQKETEHLLRLGNQVRSLEVAAEEHFLLSEEIHRGKIIQDQSEEFMEEIIHPTKQKEHEVATSEIRRLRHDLAENTKEMMKLQKSVASSRENSPQTSKSRFGF